MGAATVADVLAILDKLAPRHLAEAWDNVGLQLGAAQAAVRRLRVALDPLPEVIQNACRENIDLLITHHPLLFTPLRRLDLNSPSGQSLQLALRHNLAIACAHTNLDAAEGGVNDCLAAAIGVQLGRPLIPANCLDQAGYKLVIFVPQGSEGQVLQSLAAAGAGQIGAYSGCSFRCEGKGAFRPGPGTHPAVGVPGQVSEADELRIETIVTQSDLVTVLESVRRVHPYEEVAYDLYRLASPPQPSVGQGRICVLDKPMTLLELAQHIQQRLGVSIMRMVGAPTLMVRKLAICSGSGGGLLDAFLASDAEVFLSGDIRYHDARNVEQAGCGLLDIGHFASERLVLAPLAERLQSALEEAGFVLQVDVCQLEKDPFVLV